MDSSCQGLDFTYIGTLSWFTNVFDTNKLFFLFIGWLGIATKLSFGVKLHG